MLFVYPSSFIAVGYLSLFIPSLFISVFLFSSFSLAAAVDFFFYFRGSKPRFINARCFLLYFPSVWPCMMVSASNVIRSNSVAYFFFFSLATDSFSEKPMLIGSPLSDGSLFSSGAQWVTHRYERRYWFSNHVAVTSSLSSWYAPLWLSRSRYPGTPTHFASSQRRLSVV